jgi:hypothetical protein
MSSQHEVDPKILLEKYGDSNFMREMMRRAMCRTFYSSGNVRNEGICISTKKNKDRYTHTMSFNGKVMVQYEDDKETTVSIEEFFAKGVEAYESK